VQQVGNSIVNTPPTPEAEPAVDPDVASSPLEYIMPNDVGRLVIEGILQAKPLRPMTAPMPTKPQRRPAFFGSPRTELMPLGVLPIHAQMAEAAGFGAFHISVGMASWWINGMPHVGLMTRTEVIANAHKIAIRGDVSMVRNWLEVANGLTASNDNRSTRQLLGRRRSTAPLKDDPQ
jgi:hypothetical protein